MQAVDLRAAAWPKAPLDAAAFFYRECSPLVRPICGAGAVTVIFPAALHAHRAWRLAAIQELARAAAPGRVNGVAGADDAAIEQTVAWLARAPGVTGQLLAVDAIAPRTR